MRSLLLLLLFALFDAFPQCLQSAQAPLPVVLNTPQQVDADIRVVATEDGGLLLQSWQLAPQRVLDEMPLTSFVYGIQAQPIATDANLDGISDQLWLLGIEGRLWRISMSNGRFGTPQLMADLSDSGLNFIATVGSLRTRLPAHLVPLSWRRGDQQLLLLVAQDTENVSDTLIMLRFPVVEHARHVTRYTELDDRTMIDHSEHEDILSLTDWRTRLARAGWFVRLPGKLSTIPKVIAGVIYAPVVADLMPDQCDSEHVAQRLFAIQLHTAGLVYANRSSAIPYISQATLGVHRQPDNSLALVYQLGNERLVLLANLRKISKKCHSCTEPLTLDKFPLWQRVATYRSEQGAY